MSSAVVSTSAAQGRPFFFDDEAQAEGSCGDSRPRLSGRAQLDCRSPENQLQPRIPSKILPSTVTPASRLEIRPAPEMVSSGIPAIDAVIGGLPRGCLTEICGPASSGRTTFLLAALAAATRRGEFCTVVDASDALDPYSAASAGVALDRLLWVRCDESSPQRHRVIEKHGNQKEGCPISRAPFAREVGAGETGLSSQAAFDFDRTNSQSERRLEQVLRATDLLLESGGFGLIVLDLADLPPQAARRIPLTTWFRFRRSIEHTPTILLAIEQHPIAGSCSSLLLQLGVQNNPEETKNNKKDELAIDTPTHTHLLTGMDINAELIRSRLERKPARSVTFATKTAWAG
jgi:recA bacterial DNA recombination protein